MYQAWDIDCQGKLGLGAQITWYESYIDRQGELGLIIPSSGQAWLGGTRYVARE